MCLWVITRYLYEDTFISSDSPKQIFHPTFMIYPGNFLNTSSTDWYQSVYNVSINPTSVHNEKEFCWTAISNTHSRITINNGTTCHWWHWINWNETRKVLSGNYTWNLTHFYFHNRTSLWNENPYTSIPKDKYPIWIVIKLPIQVGFMRIPTTTDSKPPISDTTPHYHLHPSSL